MVGQQTGRGPALRACPEPPNLETAESAGLLSVELSSWPAQYTVEPPIMDTQNQENHGHSTLPRKDTIFHFIWRFSLFEKKQEFFLEGGKDLCTYSPLGSALKMYTQTCLLEKSVAV